MSEKFKVADFHEALDKNEQYTNPWPDFDPGPEVFRALVVALEAAQGVLEAYRNPRPGLLEAVMALDLAVTDRFDFGESA